MLTLVSRAVIREVTLPGTGYAKLPDVPNGTHAADIKSNTAWQVRSDPDVPGFVVPAEYDKHLPGTFVRDLWFERGRTYQIIFYVG